jgi:hypothetical protein
VAGSWSVAEQGVNAMGKVRAAILDGTQHS